jgi:hypothetical protein
VVLTTSATQVTAGQSVTLAAQVTGGSGTFPTTGTVSFKVGNVVLGTSVASNTGAAVLTASSAGISPGIYPVVAVYNGDAYNGIGASAAVNITVKDGTSSTLTVSPNPVSIGSTATLTATVSRAAASGVASGNVTFTAEGRVLATAKLSNGTAIASIPVSGISAGTYPVIATYDGDATDASSVSPAVNVTVH